MPILPSLPDSKAFRNTHSYLSDRHSLSMKALSIHVVVTSGEHYRLVGFDAPGKDDLAGCDSERLPAARDGASA
jgi:hypothetical protein